LFTYTIETSTGLTSGGGINTTSTDPFSGANTASATFTFTGALNFSDTANQNSGPSGDLNDTFGFTAANVSNYSGYGTVTEGTTPVANFSSLATYLTSSGSASNFQYASWYEIDLGVLSAGTVLTVTHDDGASVYQNGGDLGGMVEGPTGAVTNTLELTNTADTVLYYTRQNGTPSVLQVAVPEPASIALFGAGLAAIGFIRRRNQAL